MCFTTVDGSERRGARAVGRVAAQQRLDHPRILVGQRHGRAVVATASDQVLQPSALGIGLSHHVAQYRARSVNEQGANVGVAPLI